jgi:hypothetical protein
MILEADEAKARAAARQHMSFYVTRLPNYRNNLKALGWQDADFDNGCSERLVDAIVAWGSEDKRFAIASRRISQREPRTSVFNRFALATNRFPIFARYRRSLPEVVDRLNRRGGMPICMICCAQSSY